MPRKTAKADVIPVRQQNQYNCMTTSLSMALRAQGVPDEECDVQRVNKVVGAMPLRGAAWEPLLAAANHFGMRATLTLPSTVRQLKQWTDAGIPVVIAWNPEDREWSHASLVFDVDDDLNVYVADPNIPDPDETVRVVPKAEFYGKWYEKSPQGFLIRRPACAIQREITADGRQVMASQKTAGVTKDFLDMESYEVAGTGRPGLTLSPITYAYDAWEDYGKDGAVSLALGRETINMSPQRFATFAADMKKALNWASRYDYGKQSLTASAKRVASAFARKAAGERLDRNLRQKINRAMEKKGLDGNGRFRKPQEGYSRAVDVMQEHGIELDEVVSSHLFSPRPSGTVKADLAFTNEADRFSPVSITNSMLYLQYTEVSDDRFEVVAYLS